MGVEVASKIRRGVNPEHSKHWHAVGTLGCLGARAGAEKILGLGVDETRSALRIAASEAAALKKNKGTSAKPFHAGNTAKAGVVAVLLVREGLRANQDILEGQFVLAEYIVARSIVLRKSW